MVLIEMIAWWQWAILSASIILFISGAIAYTYNDATGFLIIVIGIFVLILFGYTVLGQYLPIRWWEWVMLGLVVVLFFAGAFVGSEVKDEMGDVIWILAFITFIAANCCIFSKLYFTDTKKIQRNIAKMAQLESKMVAKREESIRLRADYQREIYDLISEVRSVKSTYGINTYAQAAQNSEVSNKLLLIQHKQAYVYKLNEIIPKMDMGAIDLKYMQKRAQDDLRMYGVMGEETARNLVRDIKNVLDRYKPEEFVVKIDESRLESPEQIWNRIAY